MGMRPRLVNLCRNYYPLGFLNLCFSPCRFLDNRLFATCSDDTTIALWDLRKLNSKVCSLHGHASWVKNIEYDTNTRLLVTSGFDGNVITWDTNRLVIVYGMFILRPCACCVSVPRTVMVKIKYILIRSALYFKPISTCPGYLIVIWILFLLAFNQNALI